MNQTRNLASVILSLAAALLLIIGGLLLWQSIGGPPTHAVLTDVGVIANNGQNADPIPTDLPPATSPTAAVAVERVTDIATPPPANIVPKTKVEVPPAAQPQPVYSPTPPLPTPTPLRLPTNTPVPPATNTPLLLPTSTATPCNLQSAICNLQSYAGEPVPILMYHHIAVPPPDADQIRVGLSVYPDSFAASLDYLAANGYHTITLARYVDYVQAVQQGRTPPPLPAKPVVLTFDDGYDDAYANAYPLLKSRGMVGTFFIISGKVGWDEYATWPQLREMSVAGMDIESHTVSHADLTSLDEATLRYELATAKQQLEANLGKQVTILCYPTGSYNSFVQQLAREVGYRAATTTQYGWSATSDDLLALPRVRMWEGAAISGSIPLWPADVLQCESLTRMLKYLPICNLQLEGLQLEWERNHDRFGDD